MRFRRPEHWHGTDWETKARENPLLAIMTTPEMAEAAPTGFTSELLEEFFRRGRKLFDGHIEPLLSGLPKSALVVEYGCGAGRILKFVADAGYRAAGVDISPTMLGHCEDLVPETCELYLLDEAGRSAAPDGAAALVFSYSVLQHIGLLSAYETALDEMCRMLAPGGRLAAQLNCYDFRAGDPETPWRTENFETHSLHYRPGEAKVYKRHDQDHWSGVYIGFERLKAFLEARGVRLERWYFHNPAKPWAIWIVARKDV
jgi:SAM-dependent methyltransferase